MVNARAISTFDDTARANAQVTLATALNSLYRRIFYSTILRYFSNFLRYLRKIKGLD